MKKSESIKELAMALSKFNTEVTNPKNTAKNPQFNSKYAPLQDILNLVRPILAKNGLSILQSTTGELENVTISTLLIHSSGEYIETDPFTLRGEQTLKGGGKVLNVQGAGSMITYIRRYQISAILGLSSEDDDDGNHACERETPAPPKSTTISENQQKRLFAISKGNNEAAKKVLSKYGYSSSKEVEISKYEKICSEIEALV